VAEHPFRFGISVLSTGSRAEWRSKAKKAEDLGYDLLQVGDHLGMPAPFPALVAAADVTSIGLGTFVLNTGFYRPALLARDVADTQRLTDGRLELGLGTGYVQAEFEAAELPFPSGGQRIDHLERTIRELRRLAPDDQPAARLLIAAAADRMLRLAAREADIVAFPLGAGLDRGTDPLDGLGKCVEIVREAAGHRKVELDLFIPTVGVTPGKPNLAMFQPFLPDFSEEQLLALPGVLAGSEQQIAEKLHWLHETYGFTSFGLLEPALVDFAKVIDYLR
jgi:probable F420-dependent oxidoreductase